MSTPSQKPTGAELEREAVHEAKAVLAGEDECQCRTCKKVRAAFAEDVRSV